MTSVRRGRETRQASRTTPRQASTSYPISQASSCTLQQSGASGRCPLAVPGRAKNALAMVAPWLPMITSAERTAACLKGGMQGVVRSNGCLSWDLLVLAPQANLAT